MSDIEYSFGTGEGAPNVHHSEANVDVDGDGTNDAVALDFDGDGRVDDVMWDSDGDGVADTAVLDLDDDGVAEDAYHDPTGLGTWNAHGQGGDPQPSTQDPAPAPAPPPAPGPTDTGDPDPGGDTDTDNGYEPYGDGEDGENGTDTEGEAPGHLPGSDSDNPDSDDTGSDDTGGTAVDDSPVYEPHDDGDTSGLFDGIEDTTDTDRDSVSGWYDDLTT